MMTHRGRVVYERTRHIFSDKDVARILKGTIRFLTSDEMGEKLAGFIRETIKSDVVDPTWRTYIARIIVEETAKAFEGTTGWLEEMLLSLLDLPGLAELTTAPDVDIVDVLTKYQEKQQAKKKGGK